MPSPFSPQTSVTLSNFHVKMGRIKKLHDGIKVLGQGTMSKKLKVTAHKFSKSAEAAIISAGGEVVRL